MLRLFATIPPGFIAHAVTNSECMPLIRPGEVAVVTDQDFLYPEDGGWYLMTYVKSGGWYGLERHGRTISLVSERPRRDGGAGTWWYAKKPTTRKGAIVCSDGPYGDINHLASRIAGRVVGIYAPHRTQANPTDAELDVMLGRTPR